MTQDERPNLYHYTDALGLKGIIESKCLWATDYRFLNDAQEMRYGLAIFEAVYKKNSTSILFTNENVRGWIDNYLGHTFHSRFPETTHCVFVASLTAAPDLLSQWRGYNRGEGYSLGLDQEWVSQNAEEQNAALLQVTYDRKAQEDLIETLFESLATSLGKAPSTLQIHGCVDSWWKRVMATIAGIKHPTFSEEQEWRLISVSRTWPFQVRSRAGKKGLLPYIEISLIKKFHSFFPEPNLGFGRIIVGPALGSAQRDAVDALTASQRMRLRIEKSSIPFVGFA